MYKIKIGVTVKNSFYKSDLLSFWSVNISFSYINIGLQTLCWEIRSFCECWIL